MTIQFAFISQGTLQLQTGRESAEIQGHFAQQALDRDQRQRALHDWKQACSWTDSSNRFGAAGRVAEGKRRIRYANVASGPGPQLAFTLDLGGGAGGLFRYNVESAAERRLMHREAFAPQGLASRPGDGLLVFALPCQDGTSSIFLGERDGLKLRRLTRGDSQDAAPTWHREGDRDWIVFHSAGIRRDHDGQCVGLGPARICRVPLDHGDVETVHARDDRDYLQPRVDRTGNIYFIERPYQADAFGGASLFVSLRDLFLLPVRLVQTAFYVAHFFSLFFARQPLTSDADAQLQRRVRGEQVMHLWGQAIDLREAQQTPKRDDELRLVPSDWRLVRRSPAGDERLLARHVMAFDVGDDGTIVYSTGGAIRTISHDGDDSRLSRQLYVEQIAMLSAPKQPADLRPGVVPETVVV